MSQSVSEHAALIVHSDEPFNAEPPMASLRARFTTPQSLLYIRSHGDIPTPDAAVHRIRVDGRVTEPLALAAADLAARFPVRTVRAVIQCAGNRRADMRAVRPVKGDPWAGGAIGCVEWTGVALADVLEAAGAETGTDLHVAFEGLDTCRTSAGQTGYGVSIPMAKARDRDVLLATQIDGEPLTAAHGFPVRVVVPGFAGVRSAKWLARITVQDRPSEAYHQAADYKLYPPDMSAETEDVARGMTIDALPLNSAICEPAPGTTLAAGPTEIRGYAVASDRAVVRVDLSGDGGRSWRQADLEPQAASPWSWTFWHGMLDLPPGEHEICVRAWDSACQTQPSLPDETWNFKGYISAAWHRVRVTVA